MTNTGSSVVYLSNGTSSGGAVNVTVNVNATGSNHAYDQPLPSIYYKVAHIFLARSIDTAEWARILGHLLHGLSVPNFEFS